MSLAKWKIRKYCILVGVVCYSVYLLVCLFLYVNCPQVTSLLRSSQNFTTWSRWFFFYFFLFLFFFRMANMGCTKVECPGSSAMWLSRGELVRVKSPPDSCRKRQCDMMCSIVWTPPQSQSTSSLILHRWRVLPLRPCLEWSLLSAVHCVCGSVKSGGTMVESCAVFFF